MNKIFWNKGLAIITLLYKMEYFNFQAKMWNKRTICSFWTIVLYYRVILYGLVTSITMVMLMIYVIVWLSLINLFGIWNFKLLDNLNKNDYRKLVTTLCKPDQMRAFLQTVKYVKMQSVNGLKWFDHCSATVDTLIAAFPEYLTLKITTLKAMQTIMCLYQTAIKSICSKIN